MTSMLPFLRLCSRPGILLLANTSQQLPSVPLAGQGNTIQTLTFTHRSCPLICSRRISHVSQSSPGSFVDVRRNGQSLFTTALVGFTNPPNAPIDMLLPWPSRSPPSSTVQATLPQILVVNREDYRFVPHAVLRGRFLHSKHQHAPHLSFNPMAPIPSAGRKSIFAYVTASGGSLLLRYRHRLHQDLGTHQSPHIRGLLPLVAVPQY
jgi:hypothetical protein